MSLPWILIIVLFLGWGGGYWYGPGPVRGNNLLHIVAVIVVVLVVYQLVTGHGPRFR